MAIILKDGKLASTACQIIDVPSYTNPIKGAAAYQIVAAANNADEMAIKATPESVINSFKFADGSILEFIVADLK